MMHRSTIVCSLLMSCLLLALGPLAASAGTPSILPKEDHFEDITPGDSIIDSNGWFAETNLYAIVTNMSYTYTKPCGLPLPAASHTNTVILDTENSSVSNSFIGTSDNTNVLVDTMIQFVRSPDEDAMGTITNDSKIHLAYYVNTNGNMVLYHGVKYGGPVVFNYSNAFSTISGVSIASGEWARVHVYMDYKTDNHFIAPDKYFQLTIDGQLITNNSAFTTPITSTQTTPGTWFVCANKSGAPTKYLASVNFSGTGFIDDFHVLGDAAPPLVIISSINDARGGTIMPLGAVAVKRGEGTNFTIVTSTYWKNLVLQTNSVDVTPITNYIAFTDVQTDHTLYAGFVADRATNNVPHWWIAQQNPAWTNNFDTWAMTDPDGDGILTWIEWLASTHADDSNSLLKVSLHSDDMVNWTLSWPCAYPDPELVAPYLVLRSTNLPSEVWSVIGTVGRVSGTRNFQDTAAPAEGNVYYRVAVTNMY